MACSRFPLLACVIGLTLGTASVQAQFPPRYKTYRETPAKLDAKGTFTHKGELTVKDPRLPIYVGGYAGDAAVRYTFTVQRGKTYTFEMKGTFGPYLLLTDTKNKEIARRDSRNGKSEIVYRAGSDGPIYIYATTERSIGAFELTIRGPRSLTRVTTPPPIPPTPAAGGAITHERVPFHVGIYADALWSPDGKTIFLLMRDGRLAAYSADSLKKLREVNLKSQCIQLAYCSIGLVVVGFNGEIRVLDPNDFSEERTFLKVPSIHRLAASPKSKIAVAGVYRTDAALTVLDLNKGGPLKKYPERQSNFIALSADGKRLFGTYGAELVVWQLNERGELEEEQLSGPVIRYPQEISLSLDGAFVCVPCMGGNQNAPGHPKIGADAIYVFASNDVTRPLFVLEGAKRTQSIFLDTKSGYVATMGATKQLRLYSFRGEFLSEHELAPPGNHPSRFIGSPRGGEMLALFYRHVEIVRLPTAKRK